VGRPREHDEVTGAALVAAAERLVQERGADALSVRRVAQEVGTTTRAIYSLFGSKDGLVAAISVHGFNVLREGVERQPTTASPAQDLIAVGLVFRRFVIEHPSIFRMAFQSDQVRTDQAVRDASLAALQVLKKRVARLEEAGLLNGFSVDEATLHFDAVCEGLADFELRGTFSDVTVSEHLWRRGLRVIVDGLTLRP
jgi:AcrR family transcriptional regulator